jgi:hypothetical protein
MDRFEVIEDHFRRHMWKIQARLTTRVQISIMKIPDHPTDMIQGWKIEINNLIVDQLKDSYHDKQAEIHRF